MLHEVSTSKHPDIVVLRYYGDIETDDIITNPEEIHLNEGLPEYLLADASNVNPSVPEGMWERVHKSITTNDKPGHTAICVNSPVLRVLMGAVIKVTRQSNSVFLHQAYSQAEAQLLKLIKSGNS